MGLALPATARRQMSRACSSWNATAACSLNRTLSWKSGSARYREAVVMLFCCSRSLNIPTWRESWPRNRCEGLNPQRLNCSFLVVAHISIVSSKLLFVVLHTFCTMFLRILFVTSTKPSCQWDSAAAKRSLTSFRAKYAWKGLLIFAMAGSM